MKQCTKCKVTKSLDNFYKISKAASGKQYYRGVCKQCAIKVATDKIKNQTPEEKERWREYQKEWKRKNPDYGLRVSLKRKYGITLETYNEMLKSQNGKCKICKTTDPGIVHSDRLFVDHCHKTGKIRGLLCNRCNSVLGFADDDIETLQKAIQYLKNYNI